jgi:hypothetical protein
MLLVGLTLFVFTGCNNSPLKERVQVTDGVSVLMPRQFKKNDMGDGNVLIRSSVDAADLRVVAIKDTSLNNLSPDKLKEGLEINVNEFLKPMQGKLLNRKDTIAGKVVMSDFEFELGNAGASKHGTGKFILKGNKFITFLLVMPVTGTKDDQSLKEKFFDSIKME